MRRLARVLVVCVLLATGVLVLPASPVAADDAVVSGACSEDDFDAALTLVQNTGGGTITFNCDEKPTTITFDSEKTITTPVEIDGGGQVTLDGQGVTRLFFIEGAQPDTALTLRDIALTGGHVEDADGGAISNDGGTLTIIDSTLSGNSATGEFNTGGAIFNDSGTLTISGSTLSGNQAGASGGAIYNNSGTLTISGSTLSGNQAGSNGGAIYNNLGTLTIIRSTLSGNSATGEFSAGGAIFNERLVTLTISSSSLSGNQAGLGGAIFNDIDSIVMISGSTLSGNQAGDLGGAIYNTSSHLLTISSSTLSGNQAGSNGGAIFTNSGSVRLGTSIVASSGSSVPTCAGTITSLGYNLSTDDSCGLDPTLGDLPDTDPMLAALADNGGPTQTHLPLPGSPVIDHIPATACATDEEGSILPDQRGVARPQNGLCDIGSVEIVPYVLCADRATGEIREATDSGCGRREREMSLELDGPHTVCADRGTGKLRLVSTSDACTRYERVLVLPDDGPITVCIHRSTGELRLAGNNGCTRYEVQREIGGVSTPPPE